MKARQGEEGEDDYEDGREEEDEDEIDYDKEAAKTWVYPVNLPKREYQYNVVRDALFENTLVCLPTGLGKTFIAAVVMLNYYRWFPRGKVVFVAHTRPLVRQQISACASMTGIPAGDMCELTGQVKLAQRAACWAARRVFFLTPQVLANDIASRACPAAAIRCVVFDEAHKSVGNSAYVQVVQSVAAHTRRFRCVGLTASPGSSAAAVQSVVDNLRVARLAVRSEADADVAPYLHSKDVDVVTVRLSPALRSLRALYEPLLRDPVNRLVTMGLFYDRALERLTPFQLLEQRRALDAREAQLDPNIVASARTAFAAAVTLAGPYRLLLTQGLGPFAAALHKINDDGLRGTARYKRDLVSSDSWKLCMAAVASALAHPGDGHPKMTQLREIISEHFTNFHSGLGQGEHGQQTTASINTSNGTRAIVFATYRESVQEITRMLARVPGVRPASFIGQAAGRSGAGLRQKEQLDTLANFRAGTCNVLVATVIGEEGLDIGEVDLIVCYDSAASPTRLVQRFGRTGRKRDGRVVVLVTEGEEEVTYRRSKMRSRAIMRSLTANPKLRLCPPAPRVLPASCHPVPVEINITSSQSCFPLKVEGECDGEDIDEEEPVISDDSDERKPLPWQEQQQQQNEFDDNCVVDDFLDQDMIDKLVAEQTTETVVVEDVPQPQPPPKEPVVDMKVEIEAKKEEKNMVDEDDIVFPESAPVVLKKEEPIAEDTDEIVYPDLSSIKVASTKKEKKRRKSSASEDKKEQKHKQHKRAAEKTGIVEFFNVREPKASPPETKKVETSVPVIPVQQQLPPPPKPVQEDSPVKYKKQQWVVDVENEEESVSLDIKPVRSRSYFMSLLGFDKSAPAAPQEGQNEPQTKKKRLMQLSDSESSQSSASSMFSSQSPVKSIPTTTTRVETKSSHFDTHDLLDDEAEVSDDGHPVSSDEDEGGSSQDQYSQSFVTEDVVYEDDNGSGTGQPQPANERAMHAQSLGGSASTLFGEARFAPAGSKLVFTRMPHSKALRRMLGEVGVAEVKPANDPLLEMECSNSENDDNDDEEDDDVQIIEPPPLPPPPQKRMLVLAAPDYPAQGKVHGTRVLRLGYALEALAGVDARAAHVWCAFGTPARACALVRVATPLAEGAVLTRRVCALLRRFTSCHVVVALPPGTPTAPTAELLRKTPRITSVVVASPSANPPPLSTLLRSEEEQQEMKDEGTWERVLAGLCEETLTAQEHDVRALAEAAPTVSPLALAVVIATLGSFEAVRNADISTLIHRCALPPPVANALFTSLDFC